MFQIFLLHPENKEVQDIPEEILMQIVPLTCHVWQQLLYQSNGRTQISDTNVETAAQQGSGDDQESECWYYLSQEVDSSQTLVTSETRFNVRTEDTEVTDFPSLEEGILTQSENQVKELNRDLFCSPLPEGLQGKAESDVITLDGDAECCSLNENIVFSERVAELQRKVHDQCDLAGQYIELAALENFHDDLEMNDSSLHRQPTLQLPSEKESNIEKPETLLKEA
ncbi:centrosome-associated protein ALMS1-like isoform X2 [Aotus nancymaae]|uniref:centrosome-associated protein ALMS1-like isoform X2 n=1 Tax=Aotus nancymaae TaxID=37293 RepID=UPI0030FEC168